MQEPKFRIETPVFTWIILPDFAGYYLFFTPLFHLLERNEDVLLTMG